MQSQVTMEGKDGYVKVPTDPEKIINEAPPAYSIPLGDEERLIGGYPKESPDDDSCTPGRLCFASVMAALCCFWPAALVGMFASIRARHADNERARKYIRVGKKFVWASFIIGVVALVIAAAVQLGVTAHVMKKTWKGVKWGYVAGLEDGMHTGAGDAMSMVAAGHARLPVVIPGSADVLDINGAFWAQMMEAESPKEAGFLLGRAFGYVDGYKQGFCQSEGADCTGVKLETLADRVVKCPRMQAKLERMRAKYAAGKAGAVMHGDDDDDEDEEEHHARHGMENRMGKKKCNKHKGQAVMGEHGAAVMGVEQNDQ